MTTNKDIYAVYEKAIIVGVISEEAPEGHAVLVKVIAPDGTECSLQNILPDSDNSFVSRPVYLGDCGPGRYNVTAYYAESSASSSFTVSNNSRSSSGSNLELRLLKNVAMQAQQAVNQKLKEFIESNNLLPEDIADKYSSGVSENSLVLEAIEFRDTTDAKKHLILSIQHFREVIGSLAAERALLEQAMEFQEVESDAREDLLSKYERLKEFYFRLEELAEKNRVDKEIEFGEAVSILARSKQQIDQGDIEGSARDLERVNEMLEAIRQSLFREQRSEAASNVNASREEDGEARRLTNLADRFEKKAHSLLNQTDSEQATLKIQEALANITEARVSIEEETYGSARTALAAALASLGDAEAIIEAKDNDSGKGSSASTETSDKQ